MKKLALSAAVGLFTLGGVTGVGTAQAAPPNGARCTGSSSIWDDTDIVHLTKEGPGMLTLSWTARGHTRLKCGADSPLTGQVARIEQRIRAEVRENGFRNGQGQVRLVVGKKQHIINGRFRGTTTVNQGTLDITGVFDPDAVDVNDYLSLRQHGTLNITAKKWTSLLIDEITVGLRK